MKKNNTISICFFGSSDESKDENLAEEIVGLIEKLGEFISNIPNIKKLVAITGGYGGTMRVVSKTLKETCIELEVEIIGVTCEVFSEKDSKNSQNYNYINEFNDTIIHTKNFTERIQVMIELSDNFIVLPGKQGTLTEFLLTHEAYRYPENRIKNKKVKFYVHEYWWELLNNQSFFRKMDDIIYFNINKLNFKLSNSFKSPQVNFENNFNSKDVFLEFKNRIEGIFKINHFKNNYKYPNLKSPIINIDLAYVFYENQNKPSEAKFASFYINKYQKILKKFLNKYNSLLYSNIKNTFNISNINNRFHEEFSNNLDLNYLKEYSEIPIYKKEKKNASFDNWAKTLEENKLGKTVIWSFHSSEDEYKQFKIVISLFLTLNIEIPNVIVDKIKNEINIFYLDYKMQKVNQIFIDKQSILKRKALQSSIVSVLSRNGSHNIGSHVLNKLSNNKEIENLLDISINSKDNCELKLFKTKHYSPNKSNQPRELLRIFNSYLKNRMDFIADVATSTRAVIQTNKKLKNEIFRGIDSNLLLLEHISGKGDKFLYKIQFLNSSNEVLEDKDDLLVSIPNDILGQQAFYIIIENIIRNTAKHSGGKGNNEQVVFSIKTEEIEDINGYYRISIFDNISGKGIDELVKSRNKSIDTPILNINNEIRQSGWGTIEMKLAAAYLSMVDISDIDNKKYQTNEKRYQNPKGYFPILQAKKYTLNKIEGFGYFFYLKKPKEILIIDFTEENELKNYSSSTLKSYGIDIIYCQKEILNNENNTCNIFKNETYPHNFILLYFGDNVKLNNKNLSRIKKIINQGTLPHRIILSLNNGFYCLGLKDIVINKKIIYNNIHIKEILSKNDLDSLLNKLWGAYYLKKMPNNYQICCTSDYGTIFPKDEFKKEAFFGRHGEYNKKQYDYYEPFGTASLLGLWFKNFKYEKNKYPSKVRLLEAVATKVVIIDERIQEVLNDVCFVSEKSKQSNIEYTFHNIFESTKIFVPSKEQIDLKNLDLVKEKNKLYNYFRDIIFNVDFVVFHFGIIESLRKKDETIKDIINEIKYELNKNNTNYKFILTSGRGVTDDIPKEEYFISFSALSQYTIDIHNRSKLHLVSLLNSVRIK